MPTATTKVENYTKEMTAEMVETYINAGTGATDADHDARAKVVKELATKFKKSDRSIRSKLVREEVNGKSVYIKRGETSTVTGEKPEKKEVLAQRLVEAFGDSPTGKRLNADSLAKANKVDIQMLLTFFNSQVVEDSEMDAEEVANENDSQEGETDNES